MKICCLVKEVPDAAVQKRIDPGTKRLDRSGENNLNPFDTHGIEAAMQIREGDAAEVEEIVAVTMGPESAQRALHKRSDQAMAVSPDGKRPMATMPGSRVQNAASKAMPMRCRVEPSNNRTIIHKVPTAT